MSVATVQLGKLATVIGGYAFKSRDFVEQGVPVVKIANVTWNGVDLGDSLFLPDEFLSIKDKFHVNCGDVLISLTGSQLSQPNSVVGRVARYTYDTTALLNQRVGKLIPHDERKCDIRFVYYFLKQGTVTYQLAINAKGSANQANISGKDIEWLRVPDFAIEQQHNVVSILSAYDDLIENNRRRIQLLEQAARLLYKEWFVHLRFPGHEHVKIIDGVPEGWEIMPLGNIVATNVESYKARELPNEINYIDISSVTEGRIITKNAVSSNDAPGRARRKAKSGDVIWSNVRPNLRAYALILEPDENDVFSTGFTVLSPVAVPFSYLYVLVTTDEFVGHLVNHATGVSYPAVRPDDFERAVVWVPSPQVLELFHEKTEPILRLISVLEEEAKPLTEARDLLLPRLMNGEITV